MARSPRYEWETVVRRLALPRGVKLVAALMAQYGNPDGREVRPGRLLLAEESGYGLKQVDRHLKTLRDLGLLVRVRKGSAHGRRALADEYRLAIPEDILDRVDLVKPINVGPVDNPVDDPKSTGHQMSTDNEPGDDEQWTSDGECSGGTVDMGVPITGHQMSTHHARTTPVTTPTPKNYGSFEDDHPLESPVENVLPFRRRGAA